MAIQVSNNIPPAFPDSADLTINLVDSNAILATTVYQEVFLDIGTNTTIASLLAAQKYPRQPDWLRPLTGMDSGTNDDLASNYGSRVRALVTPPASGIYNFFIASDDNSQLLFSLTTNAANAGSYAAVSTYTGYQEWNKFSSQRSANLFLTAGQQYYIEARQKDGSQTDHVSVGWTGPRFTGTNVIDVAYLSPIDIDYPPTMTNRNFVAPLTAPTGAVVGLATASDSPLELLTYKIVSGNESNTFAIHPDTGELSVADNSAILSQSLSNFTLQIQVQDNGYADLYPRHSSYATVNVNVNYAPEILPVWLSGGNLVIQFESLLGATYVIQTTADLTPRCPGAMSAPTPARAD